MEGFGLSWFRAYVSIWDEAKVVLGLLVSGLCLNVG